MHTMHGCMEGGRERERRLYICRRKRLFINGCVCAEGLRTRGSRSVWFYALVPYLYARILKIYARSTI